MRSLVSVLVFTFSSVAFVAPSFAETPVTKPAFALMDNTGDGSKLNLDVSAIFPTHGDIDGAVIRSSLLGQYVAPNGFGGYVGISAFTQTSDHDLSAGNLEFGGLYRRALSRDVDLGVRVGFVLPTASGDHELLRGLGTLIARPADLVTALAVDPWLRLGVSPSYHHGPVFLRADLGVDTKLADGHGVDALWHVNLGAGIGHKGFSVAAELQTIFTTKFNGEMFQVAGLTARYQGTGASPYVSISTPLEHGLRGDVVTTTAGLTVPF